MEKPDFQNLEEKAAMTKINTQSFTTNHMLHSWQKYNNNEIYVNYNRFCHPVTTATNYINFPWKRVPGCDFFSPKAHLQRNKNYNYHFPALLLIKHTSNSKRANSSQI